MEYNYLPADLPVRAWEAYENYPSKYDVSLLLSIAWAVFVVPTERMDFIQKSEGKNITLVIVLQTMWQSKLQSNGRKNKMNSSHVYRAKKACTP